MSTFAARVTANCAKPVSFIHQTVDGPVHLVVRASKSGWQAFFWGTNQAEASTFRTMAEANQSVLRHFDEIYMAHRCTAECGPVEAIALHKPDDPWGLIRE